MPEHRAAEGPQTSGDEAVIQRSAGLTPVAERVLRLQQTAGNRAVAALLRSPRPPFTRPPPTRRVLARYEPGEHVQFGTSGRSVEIAGLRIDERYLIAMGDFYWDPDLLLRAKKDELKELIALIDRDESARTGKGGTSPDEDEWQRWSEKWRPERMRYMNLNKINESHFTPRNKVRWEDLHARAIRAAQASGNGSGVVSEYARTINGFAAHYLTDAFSAGHLIDKIAVKKAAKKSLNTGTNRDDLAAAIAAGILADRSATRKLTGKEIKEKAVMGSWGPPTEPRMASLLSSVMYWKEDDFLSVFARIAHDDLDEAISSGKGVWVFSKVDRWQLSGDTTLKESGRTRDNARNAVKASEDNLIEAAKIKNPPWYKPWASALDEATIQRMFDNVWQHVPEPTTSSLAGEGTQTGAAQVSAAVAKYTDARNPDTVKAIVKLSIAQFDTAIKQLKENDLIRDAPTPSSPPSPASTAPVPAGD